MVTHSEGRHQRYASDICYEGRPDMTKGLVLFQGPHRLDLLRVAALIGERDTHSSYTSGACLGRMAFPWFSNSCRGDCTLFGRGLLRFRTGFFSSAT